MDKDKLIKFLESEGYKAIREVPGRGLCGLMEFMFTIGLVYGLDHSGYAGRFCYDKDEAVSALVALKIWDGKADPMGNWIVHKGRQGDIHNKNHIPNG